MRSVLNEIGYDPEYVMLGCLITFCDDVPIPHGMTGEWFGNPTARTIFHAIDCVARTGVMPGPIQVRNHLKLTGQLEKIGGEDFFAEVMMACVGPSQVSDLVQTLQGGFAKRKVREVASWLNKCVDRDDLTPGEIASRLMEAAAVTTGATRQPVVHIGGIEHGGNDSGVSTGFYSIDTSMSTGGYADGQTNIVSAYHKGGKTTFMISSAVAQLKAGRRVLWATFADLNGKQIKRRILRNLCGWTRPPESLHLLTDYDEALSWLNAAPLDVYDASALETGFDVDTFASWLRSNHDRKEYDCVFVDYAQKLRTANSRVGSSFAEGDYCSNVMARLAASTGLPIVIGSQITKGNAKDGTESKTKNSRAWEEDAGLVIRLNKEGDRVGVEVAYSRFGPEAECSLKWNQDRLRIQEMA